MNVAINDSILEEAFTVSTDLEGAYTTSGSRLRKKSRQNVIFYYMVLSAKKYHHTQEHSQCYGTPVHKGCKTISITEFENEE